MTFEILEDGEPWQNSSGFALFMIAQARLMVARRAIPAIATTGEKLVEDIQVEADRYLAWVRSDPEAGVYITESQEYATDQISWVADELPRMFFGQLAVYLLGLLETVLVETISNVAVIYKTQVPGESLTRKLKTVLIFWIRPIKLRSIGRLYSGKKFDDGVDFEIL